MPFQFDVKPELEEESRQIFEEIKREIGESWVSKPKSEVLKEIQRLAKDKSATEVFRVMLFAPDVEEISAEIAEELVFEDVSRIERVRADHRTAYLQGSLSVSRKYIFNRHPISGRTPYSIKAQDLYNHLVNNLRNKYTDLYIRFTEEDDSTFEDSHTEKLSFEFGGITPYQTNPDFYKNSDSGDFYKLGSGSSDYYRKRNLELFNNNGSNGYSRHPLFNECNNLRGVIHNLELSIQYIEDTFINNGLQYIYLIPGYDLAPSIVSNAHPCSDYTGLSTLIFSKYDMIRNSSGLSIMGNYDYGDRGQGCCP